MEWPQMIFGFFKLKKHSFFAIFNSFSLISHVLIEGYIESFNVKLIINEFKELWFFNG